MASKKRTVINRPVARTEGLLVEPVGEEAVIYDQDTNVAHALKPLAATVFMYANGEHTVAEIAELASLRLAATVTESEAREAVEELAGLSLLEGFDDDGGRGGLSRRDALKVFGGAAAGTMLVSSIAAPFAMASTITNNGVPYICGTGSNPITGNVNGGYPNVTWYQPYTDSKGDLVSPYQPGGPATANGTYDLGSACCTDAALCTYSYTDNAGTQQSFVGACVTNSQITSGDVCALGKNAWIDGTPVGTNAAVVLGLPSGDCGTGTKVCATSIGTNLYEYAGTPYFGYCGGNNQYLIKLNSSDVTLTTSEISTPSGCSEGTYQVVPCDGSYGYQCAEVVCVPNGTTVAGAITGATSIPQDAALNDTNGDGYTSNSVVYTELLYVDIGYQYKFCTPCTANGTCS